MNPLLKLIIAVLLLLCLADMPFGFYALVRFAVAGAFTYISYDYFKHKRDGYGFLFAMLALLFQPFFPVSLGRIVWNFIDIIVAIGLIYLVVVMFRGKKK